MQVDTKVEDLRTRISQVQEVVDKQGAAAAETAAKVAATEGTEEGAGEDKLKELKTELEKEIADKIKEAEGNLNFRLDQMKVDQLQKLCNVSPLFLLLLL